MNIEYRGEIHTLKEWSEMLNFDYETARVKIQKCGWSIERAFEELKVE